MITGADPITLGTMYTALEDSRRKLRRLQDLPAGLASQILMEEDLKPVMRELHPVQAIEEAAARWGALGYATVKGEPILQDQLSGALVSRENWEYTVRPLKRHPVIARLLKLGGAFAEHWLLEPQSPIHLALARHYHADIIPERPPEGTRHVTRQCTLYVSKRQDRADRARRLDRLGHDAYADRTAALGALLGYPDCCVNAFSRLEHRWPNRIPIQHAVHRTTRFEARLNNLSLQRFAYISWFPCSYDCSASLRLADRVAETLAALNPKLVAAIDEALGKPRIYWDDDTQAVLLNAQRSGRALIHEGIQDLRELWPTSTGAAADPRITRLAGSRRVIGHPSSPRFDGEGPGEGQTPLLLPFFP